MKHGIVAICLGLVVSGCSAGTDNRPGPEKTEKAGDNKRTQDLAKQIPADFPLALYPGAKVINISKDNLPTGTIQTNVYTEVEPIGDSLPTIGTYYAEKLKAAGWKIDERDQQLQTNDFYQVIARKGNDVVQINAHKREGATITCIDLTRFEKPGPAPVP